MILLIGVTANTLTITFANQLLRALPLETGCLLMFLVLKEKNLTTLGNNY